MTKENTNRSTLKRREHWTAMAFISFKYVGFILFVFLPVIVSILYSFCNYNGAIETEPFFSRIGALWSGFDSYKELFTTYSIHFKRAVLNNIIFLISVPLGIIVGLVIAGILSRPFIKGSNVFRLLIYMPVVASAVAMNIIWRYIFDNESGIINKVFGTELMWLTDGNLLRTAIIIKTVWGSIGKTMMLLLAAMLAIDSSYYEAATVDGAGEFKKFIKITFPLITPTVFYLLTTGVIGNLQMYTDSLIFANGNHQARTIVYFIWNYGIKSSLYGIAGAASTLLSLAILILTVVQFKISNSWVYEG